MNILLVNKKHPIPADYVPNLTKIPGFEKEYCDISCLEPLTQMLSDCRTARLQPVVISGWRSYDTQLDILKNSIKVRINKGMSKEEAKMEALSCVAPPGNSEHETGLAFDIVDISDVENLTEELAETPAQLWLMDRCWEYGFILRYLKDKESITGYSYEPWHYRYVGTRISRYLKESKMCLEEYVLHQKYLC